MFNVNLYVNIPIYQVSFCGAPWLIQESSHCNWNHFYHFEKRKEIISKCLLAIEKTLLEVLVRWITISFWTLILYAFFFPINLLFIRRFCLIRWKGMQNSNSKNHVSAYKGWATCQKQKHKKHSITKISSPPRNPLWVSKTWEVVLFIYLSIKRRVWIWQLHQKVF